MIDYMLLVVGAVIVAFWLGWITGYHVCFSDLKDMLEERELNETDKRADEPF